MNENFFGQTAVYVSSPYRAEDSCQVSSKSENRLTWKILQIFGEIFKTLKKHVFVNNSRTRIFPEKRLGTFLTLIVGNIHAKSRKNP